MARLAVFLSSLACLVFALVACGPAESAAVPSPIPTPSPTPTPEPAVVARLAVEDWVRVGVRDRADEITVLLIGYIPIASELAS